MAKRRKSVAKTVTRRRRLLPAARPRAARGASDALDLDRCERFLLHEARLLDEARFDDWLALFTPDAWYWVPSAPDQDNPHDTVSLIYDDRRLLGPDPPPPVEIEAAARAARDGGAVGITFFDWTRATPAQWESLAAFRW